MRLVPSALPLTMHMRYGAAAVEEIENCRVSVTGVPLVRVNRSGPKTRKLASDVDWSVAVTCAPADPCTVTLIVSSVNACTTRLQEGAPPLISVDERIVLPFRTTEPPLTRPDPSAFPLSTRRVEPRPGCPAGEKPSTWLVELPVGVSNVRGP